MLIRDCRSLPCIDTPLAAPDAAGGAGAFAGALAIKPDGSGFAINWWPGFVAVYTDAKSRPKLSRCPLTPATTAFVVGMDWSRVTDEIVLSTDSGKILLLDPAPGQPSTPLLDLGAGTPAIEWSPHAALFAVGLRHHGDLPLSRYRRPRRAAYTGHTGKIRLVALECRWHAR